MNRRGFTLAEIIVAITLSTMVGGVILKILTTTRRATATLVERIDVNQDSRDAVHYVGAMLRELDAADGDIFQMDSTSMRFRAMTWTGVLCAPPTAGGGEVLLPIRNDAYYGSRDPSITLDSVLIFRDGDQSTSLDDRWLRGALQLVGAGPCTDGTPAKYLLVDVLPSMGGEDSVVVGTVTGAPIRGFQVQQIGIVPWNGRNWLGQSSATNAGAWSTPQPVLGPLYNRGLHFQYLDTLDVATAVPANVVSIGFTVRAESDHLAHTGSGHIDYLRDSLTTRISLRNNQR